MKTAFIVAEEEEWKFGAKTGRKVQVASSVQPVNKAAPVETRRLPSRFWTQYGTAIGVSPLYGEQSLAMMAAERAERRPPEVQNGKTKVRYGGTAEYEHEEEAQTKKPLPSFLRLGG
jgi:hypothetical protein